MKSAFNKFIAVQIIFASLLISDVCYSASPVMLGAGDTSSVTIPNNPEVSPMPNYQAGGQGLDLSGANRRQQNKIENIDLTESAQNGNQNQAQVQNQNNLQVANNDFATEIAQNLTDVQINDYFTQILNGNNEQSPVGDLIRGMPRFGMNFFRQAPSTFAPEDRAPVTQNYRINIGDELTINIWGIPEEGNYTVSVNRDGMTTIPHIGAVRIAGYTMAEAERIIQARLNQYYTGYQMNLSMGRLSSIMIYVTGNARRPGAYTVSSFATLVNALLVSGGPSANGTLRRIELKRNGQIITVFDMYAMLLQGDKSQDTRLQAGDVIYIPQVGDLVGLAGEVQRPGVYELNGETRVKDLLSIAGGMSALTYRGRAQYFKVYDHAYAGAFEGTLDELSSIVLSDGDILRLYPIYNLVATAEITGPVTRPGSYVIVPGRTRLSEIINRAGGLSATASDRAEITRITPANEGQKNERFVVNVSQALLGDPDNNILIEHGDHITLMTIPNYHGHVKVNITGEIMRPGTYSMLPGEKISDLITRAGGFTPKAFLRGAVFTRRSVAEEQRIAIRQMADRMERDLMESMQNSTENNASEYTRRREMINRLRQVDIMGRVITKIDTPKNIIDTPWDYELEDGDTLNIPDKPLIVNVMGAVYSSSSQVFRPGISINSYINAAGGAVKTAHKRMVYLLKSDGSTLKLTRNTSVLSNKKWVAPRGFSPVVEPGDTIVVPVKYTDRQSLIQFREAIDTIYKVAVAAGVILDLDD